MASHNHDSGMIDHPTEFPTEILLLQSLERRFASILGRFYHMMTLLATNFSQRSSSPYVAGTCHKRIYIGA